MPVVYLTHQGAQVARQGETLVIREEDRTIADVEIHHVDGLCVFGRVHLTLPAMELLMNHHVSTSFLTIHGRLKGQLVPAHPRNVSTRIRQFQCRADATRRLAWARNIVHAKLHNAAEVVRRFAYNHPESGVAGQAAEVKAAADRAFQASSFPTLRGIEGAGSRVYFESMKRMCLGAMTFGGRFRRPPADPFNAMLSFGYVLLGNEIASLLEAVGLEPCLGFYHEPADNRPALALDLIEEFRHAMIDRFCLMLNNRREFSKEDFEADPEENYRFRPDSLKRFLTAYDRWMRTSFSENRPTPRQVIRGQIENLIDALKTGKVYEPFLFES